MPGETSCPLCGAESDADGQCVKCLLGLALGNPPALSAKVLSDPGTAVEHFGDYLLQREIARGGMGVVYEAQQLSLNRLVALKMILAGQLASETEVRRFQAEAEAAAKLAHPNIVPIYEIGEYRGQHYFSMELVDGSHLAAKLKGSGWKMEERVKLLVSVARAVHHAHQRGIIHRDLKPSNILIDPMDQPRITDFGLARCTNDDRKQTQSGVAMGTPDYMAPEQVLGQSKQMTTAVDVWALGVILYQILTEQLPFAAETRDAIWRRILDEEPRRPSVLNRKVDVDLETICLTCLQKAPANRYRSAEELAEDLERWLRNESITARRIGFLESAAKWARRRPAIAGLYFVACVSALSIAVLVIQNRARVKEERDAYLLERNAAFLAKSDAERQREIAAAARTNAIAERDAALLAKAESVRHQQATEKAHSENVRLLSKLEFVKAEELLGSGKTGLGLAYLAQVLRREPTNKLVAERLLSALSLRSFALPKHAKMNSLDGIANVIFSPDGRKVASSSLLGGINLWDPVNGTLLAKIKTDDVALSTTMWFSADGKKLGTTSRIAANSRNSIVRVWNPNTGSLITEGIFPTGEVRRAEFSMDGSRLVTVSWDLLGQLPENFVQLWNIAPDHTTNRLLRQWSGPTAARFGPGGNSLVTINGALVHLWDAENFKLLGDWDFLPSRLLRTATMPAVRDLLDQASPVKDAVITADGRRLITSLGRRALIWNLARTQELTKPMFHESEIESTTVSPDFDRIATVCRDGVYIWNSRSGQKLFGPLNAEVLNTEAEFNASGLKLCVWSQESGFRVWDVHFGRPLTESLTGTFRACSFSPNGDQVAVVQANQGAWIWEVGAGHASPLLLPHSTTVSSARFNRTGDRVVTASADHTVRIWSAATGKPENKMLPHDDQVSTAEFSRDGRLIITACRDEWLRIWDTETGRQLHRFEADDYVRFTRLSADGSRLLAISDGELLLWDVQKETVILTGKDANRDAVFADFSPDGRFVASYDEEKVTVIEASTGKKVATLKHDAEVSSVQFSFDGGRIASGTIRGTAYVWDIRRPKTPIASAIHRGPLRSTTFSPDGKRLLTASWDTTTRVWDAQTGQPLLEPMKHNGPVQHAGFSPNGTRIVTVSGRHVRLWNSVTGQAVSEPLEHNRDVKSVEFSPDSRQLVTTCGDSALLWTVPEIDASVPAWLSELGEVIAGQRINSDGTTVPVPFEDLVAMKTARETATGDGQYDVFAKWLFANRTVRATSPYSIVANPDEAERLIAENTFESLEQAVRLAPTNALALARFAQRIVAQDSNTGLPYMGTAGALIKRALILSPNDAEVVRLAAVVREVLTSSP